MFARFGPRAIALAAFGPLVLSAAHVARAAEVTPSPSPRPSPTLLRAIGTVSVASKTRRAISTLPIGADALGTSEIRAQAGRTLESALNAVPGYAGAGAGEMYLGPHSNYAELRGLGPGSVLVTFDGVPINDPLGSWVSWSRVPKLLVGSIEAAHGGASALYGSQAVGGAIAIESIHPNRDDVAFDSFTGNLGTTGNAVAASKSLGGDWGLAVYGDRTDIKGYIRDIGPTSVSPLDPYARNVTQRINAQIARTTPGAVLEFGTSDANEHRSGDFSGPSYYYGRSDFFRYSRQGNGHGVDVVTYLSNDTYDFDRFGGTPTKYVEQGFGRMSLDTAGLTASASQAFGAATFTLGADGRNVAGNRNEPRFASSSTFVTGNQQFAGTFAQSDLVVGRSDLLAGVRYDVYSQRQASELLYGASRGGYPFGATGSIPFPTSAAHHVSPRIAYRYKVGSTLVVRASFGDAFKAPDWGSLYSTYPLGGGAVVQGNPLLRAQSTDQREIGVEFDPSYRTRAYLTFFNAVENGRIVLSRLSSTLYENENIGQARSGGYEASLQQSLGERFSLRASYANTPSTIALSSNSATIGHLIPQAPVSTGYVGLRYGDAHFSLESGLRSLGRAFADEQNSQPIDGALTFDESANYHIAGIGEAYIEIQNLFDRQWLAEAATYAPPRSIVFGIRRNVR